MVTFERQVRDIAPDAIEFHRDFYWSPEFCSGIYRNPDTMQLEVLSLKKSKKVFLRLVLQEIREQCQSTAHLYQEYKEQLRVLGLTTQFLRRVFFYKLLLSSGLITGILVPPLTLLYFMTNPQSFLIGGPIFLITCLISGAIFTYLLEVP